MKAKKYAVGGYNIAAINAKMQQERAALRNKRKADFANAKAAEKAAKATSTRSAPATPYMSTAQQQFMATQPRPTSASQQTQTQNQMNMQKALTAQGTSTSPAPSMPKPTQSQQTTTPKIPLADMQASVNKKQNSFFQADYNAMQQEQRQPRPMMAKGGVVAANCGASMKPAQKRK